MKKDNYLLHIFLFLLSVLTTLLAGAELVSGKIWFGWGLIDAPPASFLDLSDLGRGWAFSFAFLLFLTVHEFGHYFTARYHKVHTSLPFYIPLFIPFPGLMNIGSMGAMIRIRQIPDSTRKFFDIGIAGPLAGFVISIGLLVYGFSTLPPAEEYISQIHPEYMVQYGGIPTEAQVKQDMGGAYAVGHSLLFEFMKNTIPADPEQVPPDFELMHYPWIFVGFLTLFFTALNLLPIGQLDGGHVIYGLFGVKKAKIISRVAVIALMAFGGLGIARIDIPEGVDLIHQPEWMLEGLLSQLTSILLYFGYLFIVFRKLFKDKPTKVHLLAAAGMFIGQGILNHIFPSLQPYPLWLMYVLLVTFLLGVDHPPARVEKPLNLPRKILGWVAILIFILSFAPYPLRIF